MATWWVVDPQSGRGAQLNDQAANDAAADGAMVYPYTGQDGGLGQMGYDPNVALGHQLTGDRVLVYNAQTQRYEWMSRALVDAQNAATQAYGAQTQRAATAADIIAASRGPENAFQYSNALHGVPDASGVGIFDALAGRLGGSTSAGTPAAGDLHPNDIMAQVQAILRRSFGTGGEHGAGSSSWADAAGMAPTEKEQQARGVLQDAQQGAPGGQQGVAGPQLAYKDAARSVEPSTGILSNAPATDPDPHAPKLLGAAGTNAPLAPAPMTAYGPSRAIYDPLSGKVDTGQYAPLTGVSGHGDSDIAWKNKSHQLIEGHNFGHGSDARNAAHKAAGMTGEEFDRIVKHGGDPFKQRHAEHGMLDVITGPTTIHAGEGGKDEIHIIIPMEQKDQPVPRALLALANMQSPDLDRMRGAGGVTDGPPTLDMQKKPDGSYGMAAGGGLAVLGGSTTVTPANSKVNAAGQVKVPMGRKTKMVPASQTTPMPDFSSLPPALLSLISPSDWQLIGSQFGAAGGNAADIPFLLRRGTQGLGQGPRAFGGRTF